MVNHSPELRGLTNAGLLLTTLMLLQGCATVPYTFGAASRYRTSPELAAMTGDQIERGKPNVVIDSFGWVWGIPGKIMLWDRRVENHRIDPRTEAELAAYLSDNELTTVKVRLNQYHPGDDWKRLVANKSVGAGWRYTVGAFSVLGETILPGRMFGGDHYNPFTNTIHLYSGAPPIALHEAGHAKDYAYRTWKGTYAVSRILPVAPLFQEAIATGDALGYLRATRDLTAQQEAYELLYPAYGTYVGNELSGYVPLGFLAGVLGGHAAGQWKSWSLQKEYDAAGSRHRYERQPAAQSEAASSSPAVGQEQRVSETPSDDDHWLEERTENAELIRAVPI